MEHQDFYEGLFLTMERAEKQYAPNGSNYHDHLCTCPGCNYDGPEPTDQEVIEMAWRDLQAVPSYVERLADETPAYPEQEMDELAENWHDLY